MRTNQLFLAFALTCGICTASSAQVFQWARQSDGTDATSNSTSAAAVSSDASYNCYSMTRTGIEKRSSGGSLSWSHPIISNTDYFPLDMVADRLGNVYFTGYYVSEKPAADPDFTMTLGSATRILPTQPFAERVHGIQIVPCQSEHFRRPAMDKNIQLYF